jgi:hypothetical protein
MLTITPTTIGTATLGLTLFNLYEHVCVHMYVICMPVQMPCGVCVCVCAREQCSDAAACMRCLDFVVYNPVLLHSAIYMQPLKATFEGSMSFAC